MKKGRNNRKKEQRRKRKEGRQGDIGSGSAKGSSGEGLEDERGVRKGNSRATAERWLVVAMIMLPSKDC